MQLVLSGHLAFYHPQKSSKIEIHLERKTLLLEILKRYGIPVSEIAIVLVNGNTQKIEDYFVNNHDHVELFPPIGGG